MNSSPGSQVLWQNSHTTYVWARQRPTFVTRTFCECMIQVAHIPGIEAHTNGIHSECLPSCFSPIPNHPATLSSLILSTLMCVHVCIHMYAWDHCDHPHTRPHNTLYSPSTKHMSVYWTRYCSTFDCKHSTPEGGRLEGLTHLQQKGVQLSASNSHYEMCSWQCTTVWGCVNEPCCAQAP